MAVISDVTKVLHRIRARLYPNYLHGIDGAFLARTDDEASLSIEQVCAALKPLRDLASHIEVLIEGVAETAGFIVGIIPALAAGQWQVETVSQVSSGGTTIKEPRTVRLAAALTVSP